MTFPREGYSPRGWESKNDEQEADQPSKNRPKMEKANGTIDTKNQSISQKYDLLQERVFKSKYNISGWSSILVVLALVVLGITLQIVDNSNEINRANRKSKGPVDTSIWEKIGDNSKFVAYADRNTDENKERAEKLAKDLMAAMGNIDKSSRAFDNDILIENRRYQPLCSAKYESGLDWDCMITGRDTAEIYYIDLKEK
ncbi:hypothetical protein I6J24_01380 [Corynebacterium kroppenstedtii]|nr:hypothetical protein I6J24_01380 [Corynebacterium kroppenstedtii]